MVDKLQWKNKSCNLCPIQTKKPVKFISPDYVMDPHILVSLFHIFAVVPFFLYVAFNREAVSAYIYTALLVLGLGIGVYHGYKALRRYQIQSPYLWVNLIHVFYVAPLLIYIGYYEKSTPRPAYELLAMIAFAALGYHLYSLVLNINSIQDRHD
jgi:hypothetical protein